MKIEGLSKICKVADIEGFNQFLVEHLDYDQDITIINFNNSWHVWKHSPSFPEVDMVWLDSKNHRWRFLEFLGSREGYREHKINL